MEKEEKQANTPPKGFVQVAMEEIKSEVVDWFNVIKYICFVQRDIPEINLRCFNREKRIH